MENINIHIQYNEVKMYDPLISSQSRRHYEEELKELKTYKNNHPEDDYDPTNLELFCDQNPDSPECRIYES
jgi:hypothetical protein